MSHRAPTTIRNTGERGLTLIEMLVVTGIIALISGLVLANNNRFGGQVLLQNLAYDIALSIREAQIYGISVQQFQGTYGYSYGMYFQPSTSGGRTIYVLFADTDDNGLYDGTAELVQSTAIASGYAVADLCATPVSSIERCGLSSLAITFRRPEPDAYIRTQDHAGLHESARIILRSPRGETKQVVVGVNGQISVQ